MLNSNKRPTSEHKVMQIKMMFQHNRFRLYLRISTLLRQESIPKNE